MNCLQASADSANGTLAGRFEPRGEPVRNFQAIASITWR